MGKKKTILKRDTESGLGMLSNSTEYTTNHPQKINWKKAKTCVRSFVKSHKKVLRQACQG